MTLGTGCAIEPEVDLSGYWLDGDVLHIGRITIDEGASVGARSTLGPGARVGVDAEVEPGSFVSGAVPAGERWAGSPAGHVGRAGTDWPDHAPRPRRRWQAVYGVTSALLSLLPLVAALPALAVLDVFVADATSLPALTWRALAAAPLAALAWFGSLAVLFALLIRSLGIRLRAGTHPVRSRIGWQAWAVERLMDAARTLLFPLYSSLLTPGWLRLLGADVGRRVEASTVLVQPKMTSIGDGAFLADDTMVASYNCAAVGCASSRRRSASAPSSATPG